MKKRDLLILGAVLAVAAVLLVAGYFISHSGREDTVEVYLGNALYTSAPLNEDAVLEISQPDGAVNHVEIKGGAVRMLDSNCSNQDCVRIGPVSAENQGIHFATIVCLPHKVTVELRLGGEDEG